MKIHLLSIYPFKVKALKSCCPNLSRLFLPVVGSLLSLPLQGQTVFDFSSAVAVAATPSGTGYKETGAGTYYRNTSGSSVSFGTKSCDGFGKSASTAGSLFIFKAEMDISAISIRGQGTSSNRTFSDLAVNSTVNLNGAYTAQAYTATGSIGNPTATTCGEIVVAPSSVIAAGTYMKLAFSGNLYVTSIVLNPGSASGGSIPPPPQDTTTSVANGPPPVLPSRIVPSTSGAHIHFNSHIDFNLSDNTTAMNEFQNAGVKFARVVIPWFDVERTKGVYTFTDNQRYTPGYVNGLNAFTSRGIRPIITLGFGNSLYGETQGKPITSTTGLTAFSNYCKAIAERFRDLNPIFEIWNEPNLSTFGSYTGPQYVALAKNAKNGILAGWREGRESPDLADPLILGPAVANSWARGNMLDQCFDAGLLDVVTGVSFHPYANRNPTVTRRTPETGADAVKSLRDELARRGKPDMPLVFTEWGWSTGGFDYEISEAQQAKFHSRQLLIGYYSKLAAHCIYSMADARNDDVRTENDKHYGMFTTMGADFKKTLTAKSSITSIGSFTNSLSGYKYTERVNMGDDGTLTAANDWCLVFWNPTTGAAKVAVWTEEENITKISPSLKPLLGLPQSVIVNFTDSPVYVAINGYTPPAGNDTSTINRD